MRPHHTKTNLFVERAAFVADEEGRMRYPLDKIHDAAEVVAGEMLVFRQELLHEGEPVGTGACPLHGFSVFFKR